MRTATWALLLTLLAASLSGCLTDGDPGEDEVDETTDGGDDGDPLPPELTWASLDQALIRPGAPLGGYCTFNWIFTAANGSAYIGTAGHCTEGIGGRVTLGTTGEEIGTVVYDSDNRTGADERVDFSLILLDPGQVTHTNPTMIGTNGPTGTIEAGAAAPGDDLAIYGHGLILGDQEETRPRSGVLMDEDGETYRANLPAVQGDSGSPLLHVETGKAFGIISEFGVSEVPPSTDTGPIMPFILSELKDAGYDVSVATV